MKRIISLSIAAVFLFTALSLSLPTSASPAGGPPFAGTVRFLALLAATDQVETSSGDVFEDMPNMSGTITTSASGCVTATLSYQSGATSCRIRILLDDSVMEGQAIKVEVDGVLVTLYEYGVLVTLYELRPGSGGVSYTTWMCNVSSGNHVVAVEWATPSCETFGRTLVVTGP